MAFPRDVDLHAQSSLLRHLWPGDRSFLAEIAADLAAAGASPTPARRCASSSSHDDITKYNAIQRVLYVGIILVLIVQVISGLAIWKPVQFQELTALFYDFQGARLAHFIGMALIVLFLVVHVALALVVPKTLAAMVTGGPVVDDERRPPPASGG